MDDIIGNMNWDACDTCEHGCDEEGCDFTLGEIVSELSIELGDFLCCGLYEPEED